MDMSPWGAKLRPLVHVCTPREALVLPHQWIQLMDAVHAARSAGMPLLHIGYFLSEMHRSSKCNACHACPTLLEH